MNTIVEIEAKLNSTSGQIEKDLNEIKESLGSAVLMINKKGEAKVEGPTDIMPEAHKILVETTKGDGMELADYLNEIHTALHKIDQSWLD